VVATTGRATADGVGRGPPAGATYRAAEGSEGAQTTSPICLAMETTGQPSIRMARARDTARASESTPRANASTIVATP
jgi:hypothetical protein